jgi:AhpD family alkylhydroperoxidase
LQGNPRFGKSQFRKGLSIYQQIVKQGGNKLAEQEKLHGEMSQMWEIYKKCMPDVASAYDELPMEVYKDGVLSGKIKRMMALTGALVHGCRACILYQTEEALTLGATAEEILEACAVAISLGSTMGAGETTRVVQFLEEKGLLDELKKDN